MRGVSRPLRIGNAALLAALAILVAIEPTTALLFGIAAVPLWLALFAGRRVGGTVLRGCAIGANALATLPCVMMLLLILVHFAQAPTDTVKTLQGLALFAPLLVLYLLNMRALVGPSDDAR